MWIFTTLGFFSVVQKPDDEHLTIRARARVSERTAQNIDGRIRSNLLILHARVVSRPG